MVHRPFHNPSLLRPATQPIITKSTPIQTDSWSCGLHMLLINLATIYQGAIPTLRHTQAHAHQLSKIHLRYTLTGELDANIPQIIQELSCTDPTRPWPHPPIHHTKQPKRLRKSNRKRPRQPNQTLSHHPPTKTHKRNREPTIPTSPHPTKHTHTEPPSKRSKPHTNNHKYTSRETHTPTTNTTTLVQPQQTKRQKTGRRRSIRTTRPNPTPSQLNLLQCKAWIPNVQQKPNQTHQPPPSHPDQSNRETSPQPHPPTTPTTPPQKKYGQ